VTPLMHDDRTKHSSSSIWPCCVFWYCGVIKPWSTMSAATFGLFFCEGFTNSTLTVLLLYSYLLTVLSNGFEVLGLTSRQCDFVRLDPWTNPTLALTMMMSWWCYENSCTKKPNQDLIRASLLVLLPLFRTSVISPRPCRNTILPDGPSLHDRRTFNQKTSSRTHKPCVA
jgi:hypothetical protein